MKIKPNYFIIPLITIIVSLTGSYITSAGMEWYATIKLPSFTPPGSVIGTVWTILFILATIAALLFWNRGQRGLKFNLTVIFFLLNGLLNILWSYLFFGQHLIGLAIWEAGLLGLSVLILIILLWPKLKLAAWLLVPYLLWVGFATYLTYNVWLLNK